VIVVYGRRMPTFFALLALTASAQAVERARDLGIVIGPFATGAQDAITDVAGVEVGQTTLIRGDGKLVSGKGPVRTGVTAVLPHAGDLWRDKVAAAAFVMNGNGEVTGLHWVNEQGALEVPIVLTNTMNVPRVSDAVITWMMKSHPEIGVTDDVVLPVVGECDDSDLNDARGRHVSEADVLNALDHATTNVVEGAVGAGTGMIAYGFKSGIGTASRVVAKEDGGYTIGVLVNANMGPRSQLTIAGKNLGALFAKDPPIPEAPGEGHSIIVVVATDAPVDSRQLQRIARRAMLGVARTGSSAHHGSGDFVIAFSTKTRVPHEPKDATRTVTLLSDDRLDPLFDASADAAEEAVVNSLLAATTTKGRDGVTAYAIPHDKLRALFGERAQPRNPTP
jgi:D-aminopeptidase